MNDTIFVITAFYITYNYKGEKSKVNERMVWCSTKEEAIEFINDSYNMDSFVRNNCKYIVIEEVKKLYGFVKAIGWWEAKYKDSIYPTMVKLNKCPINNYEEDDENHIKLISL